MPEQPAGEPAAGMKLSVNSVPAKSLTPLPAGTVMATPGLNEVSYSKEAFGASALMVTSLPADTRPREEGLKRLVAERPTLYSQRTFVP